MTIPPGLQVPLSKALSNIASICHRLLASSSSPQGRSLVLVWFLQTHVLPGICVRGGRRRWKCTLPCQPSRRGYGGLCSPRDFVAGRDDSSLHGTARKITCYSPGEALPDLGCSVYRKGRRGEQSWEAEPREATEGWHISSRCRRAGREQLLPVLTLPSSSNFGFPQVWHRQSKAAWPRSLFCQ